MHVSSFESKLPRKRLNSAKQRMDSDNFVEESKNESEMEHEFPPGYNEDDDLDGDGLIDPLEEQIKVQFLKNDLQEEIRDKIKNEYRSKF